MHWQIDCETDILRNREEFVDSLRYNGVRDEQNSTEAAGRGCSRVEMMGFLEPLLTGPMLPATFLLGLLLAWSLLSLLAGWHLDVPAGDEGIDWAGGHGAHDAHLPHADAHATDSLSGWWLMTLRWLNLDDVPLLWWLGLFSFLWWNLSLVLWLFVDEPLFGPVGIGASLVLSLKNFLLAVFVTRSLAPRFRLESGEGAITSQSLIGRECEISSLEASPTFGQAKMPTDGAPLLLNVRTDGPHLSKGTRVWITYFDAERRVYIVSPTTT